MRWQYQSKADPLAPLAAPEEVTLDKWYQPPSQPIRRLAAVALLAVGAFGPVTVPAAAPAGVDVWQPTYPDRLNRPASPRHDYGVEPLAVEPTSADRWWPTYPDRLRGRQAPRLGESVRPLAVEPTTADRWWPTYPDRARPRPAAPARPFVAAPPQDFAAPAEVVWWGGSIHPDRVAVDRRRADGWLAEPVLVPAPAPALELWRPAYPDQSPRRQRRADGAFAFVELVAAPAPPLELWRGAYPDVVRRPGRPNGGWDVEPVFVPAAAPAPDQWWPVWTQPLPRRRPVLHTAAGEVPYVPAPPVGAGAMLLRMIEEGLWVSHG